LQNDCVCQDWVRFANPVDSWGTAECRALSTEQTAASLTGVEAIGFDLQIRSEPGQAGSDSRGRCTLSAENWVRIAITVVCGRIGFVPQILWTVPCALTSLDATRDARRSRKRGHPRQWPDKLFEFQRSSVRCPSQVRTCTFACLDVVSRFEK
jgi:hypothetical protein